MLRSGHPRPGTSPSRLQPLTPNKTLRRQSGQPLPPLSGGKKKKDTKKFASSRGTASEGLSGRSPRFSGPLGRAEPLRSSGPGSRRQPPFSLTENSGFAASLLAATAQKQRVLIFHSPHAPDSACPPSPLGSGAGFLTPARFPHGPAELPPLPAARDGAASTGLSPTFPLSFPPSL